MNKPPEKIYVDSKNSIGTHMIVASHKKLKGMDLEYHLAPEWVSVEDGLPAKNKFVPIVYTDGAHGWGEYCKYDDIDYWSTDEGVCDTELVRCWLDNVPAPPEASE